VIPSNWQPVRREDDDELVGYLTPDGTTVNLIGIPTAHLEWNGLASLDGRWLCRLPDPLPRLVDASEPAADWHWRSVVIVETSPTVCRVRPQLAEPTELLSAAVLPVPVDGLLRREGG
jgi:hypothetical protein